jgi:shikimate dehydrogenase
LVYNAIFRQLNANYIYLPVVTGRAERVLPLLELLQFSGCSVTMPAKEVLARQLAADHLDDGARALAALNTLVCRAGQWTGANTDVLAVYSLLEDECRDAKKRVLVLGAGGAARAAVYALSKLGCHVTVCGRTAERSAALADDLGVQSVPWEQRAAQPFDIVINATPIGADGISDPLEQVASFENRTVVDAVLARKDTPLLQRARADGARVVDGRAWWLEQGAQQITMLTPLPITREQIAEQLYETTDE